MTGRYKAYPEYMTADSKWLDEIPAHWKVAALKHVLSTPITDGPHSTPIFQDEGIPFVSAEAVSGGYINFDKIRGHISEEDDALFSQKYRPQLHDVYMIKSGATTGISAIVETNRRFNIWSPLAVMRCKKSYDPYFLLNYLRSDSFQKSVQLSWTFGTQQNIGMNTLENLTVCFPPFEEQQKIANFLNHETTKIDTLIAKQEKLIELLKEKRQAVISHAVTKGLNPDAPMKDSGVEWLGDVPEHWDMKRLKYIGEAKNGLTYSPDDVVPEGEGVLVLRSSNIQDAKLSFTNNVYVNMDIPLRIRTQKDDLLICSRNGSRQLIGKNALITEEAVDMAFGAFMVVFRSKLNPYLYWVLNSPLFEYQSGSFLTSTINQLTIGNLESMEIPLPPSDEQELIRQYLIEKMDYFDQLISKSACKVDLLKERKTALISAAVTGKIDVRDWQESA
ncbi:restriction endonuclease subunit S [Vibrio parahaemolyticus]|nr:restriction endonuclease subunit S [Vibrio parahaemolyticus]MDF5035994.1 restriction endonuclease subunit S [Vibrio parahaemolyticus]MDF5220185.1 restriction endonuclease subunit S [Vibrio parahaemolyticus]MDF5684834.1 restriction endonuclease subunit S [Vibrio parahaemolyticus]